MVPYCPFQSARALREAEVLEKDATDTLSDTGDLNTFVEDGAQVAQSKLSLFSYFPPHLTCMSH